MARTALASLLESLLAQLKGHVVVVGPWGGRRCCGKMKRTLLREDGREAAWKMHGKEGNAREKERARYDENRLVETRKSESERKRRTKETDRQTKRDKEGQKERGRETQREGKREREMEHTKEHIHFRTHEKLSDLE